MPLRRRCFASKSSSSSSSSSYWRSSFWLWPRRSTLTIQSTQCSDEDGDEQDWTMTDETTLAFLPDGIPSMVHATMTTMTTTAMQHDSDDDDEEDDDWDEQSSSSLNNNNNNNNNNKLVSRYDQALQLVVNERFDDALQCLQNETDHRSRLLTAQLLARVGRFQESLQRHEDLLLLLSLSSSDNKDVNEPPLSQQQQQQQLLLYSCGRLCIALHDHGKAKHYMERQLTVVPQPSLAAARIHHSLAQVQDDDHDEELQHYQQAWRMEHAVLLQHEQECGCRPKNNNNAAAVAVGCCSKRGEIEQAMAHTKRCMGRIHYHKGNFQKAVQLSL